MCVDLPATALIIGLTWQKPIVSNVSDPLVSQELISNLYNLRQLLLSSQRNLRIRRLR